MKEDEIRRRLDSAIKVDTSGPKIYYLNIESGGEILAITGFNVVYYTPQEVETQKQLLIDSLVEALKD